MKIKFILLVPALLIFLGACSNDEASIEEEVDMSTIRPPLSEFSEAEQEKIKYGEKLNTDTHLLLPENVGNNLSCVSCHAGAGRTKDLTFVGVTEKYPKYMARAGKEVSLEERINGCFSRSMNGKPIDPESEEMEAFISYYEYLSKDIDSPDQYEFMTVQHTAESVPAPNVEQGARDLTRYNCLSCHGQSGPEAANTGPALWGPDSFNDGAGLSRISKLQYYIKNYMPKGEGGTLSEQEASNIAAYILMQDRPEFEGERGFPNGDGPGDYITKEKREALKENLMDWTDFKQVEAE